MLKAGNKYKYLKKKWTVEIYLFISDVLVFFFFFLICIKKKHLDLIEINFTPNIKKFNYGTIK